MSTTDCTQRFSFDLAPVRGRIIRLRETWAQLRERRAYSAAAERVLGDIAAATGLMAQDLKFDGSVIIQVRRGRDHDGPGLRTAMAECRGHDTLRGIVRSDSDSDVPAATDLTTLFGRGDLAITLRADDGAMYQGVVQLEAGDLATHLERYFAASEQLPTRIWLASDATVAAGLMLQRLPGAVMDDDALDQWRRITLLAETLTAAELLHLEPERLLRRLFHSDRVRVQPAQPIVFGCSCTRDRSSNALRLLGSEEVAEILAADGRVTVTCEFCGATYHYDAVDATLLFHPHPDPVSGSIH